MNLVKFLVLNFFIGAFLLPTIAIAQSDVKETVQINIEGSELTKFTVEVDGNNILINGKSPAEAGVKLNITRQKTGTDVRNISEYGLSVEDSKKARSIANPSGPMLGAVTIDVAQGVQVIEIRSDGAARFAGIRVGDVIVKFEDQNIKNNADLAEYIKSKNPGDAVTVDYIRKDNLVSKEIVLGLRNSRVENDRRRINKVDSNPSSPKSLGMKLIEDKSDKAWRIIEITRHSSAETVGVKVDDILVELNNVRIKRAADLERAMKTINFDEPIKLKVRREKSIIDLEIK